MRVIGSDEEEYVGYANGGIRGVIRGRVVPPAQYGMLCLADDRYKGSPLIDEGVWVDRGTVARWVDFECLIVAGYRVYDKVAEFLLESPIDQVLRGFLASWEQFSGLSPEEREGLRFDRRLGLEVGDRVKRCDGVEFTYLKDFDFEREGELYCFVDVIDRGQKQLVSKI